MTQAFYFAYVALATSVFFSNVSEAKIKGFALEACDTNEADLKERLVREVVVAKTLCGPNLIPIHIGGFTCQSVAKQECAKTKQRCVTQFVCSDEESPVAKVEKKETQPSAPSVSAPPTESKDLKMEAHKSGVAAGLEKVKSAEGEVLAKVTSPGISGKITLPGLKNETPPKTVAQSNFGDAMGACQTYHETMPHPDLPTMTLNVEVIGMEAGKCKVTVVTNSEEEEKEVCFFDETQRKSVKATGGQAFSGFFEDGKTCHKAGG